ncbi:alpha/beta hydrolase [Cryptosporangium arvum]|uniref:alpha/beta hydrolase n=1 Tax=Cryptosporangium arvum TaxID=80871 RepID=UPI0004AD5262|nr:alpha/beta hydrolase-fold protein [Cryptosporangium arvum]
MSLIGLPLLLVLSAALLVVLAVTLIGWNRWPRLVAWPARALCLLLVMVLPVAVSGDLMNRYYGFYTSWSDLTGGPVDVRLTTAAELHHERVSPSDLADGRAAAAHGHGIMIPWAMPGARSRINRSGYVYLPAAYFDRARSTERFPVIELLHGYSGSPHNWVHALPIASMLDTEIAAGRMAPVIAVAPYEYDRNDGECVNAVRGEQNETYLARDVPADIANAFRTATAPGSWSTLGFSTGGFCAVDMALHAPGTYRAAVSLSGYFNALTDASTGDLYRGDLAVRHYDSPAWFVRHRPVHPSLYVFASGGDKAAMREIAPFRRAVPAGTDLTTVTVPTGGHNTTVWNAALPPALDWLGHRLPAPTTTPLVAK